MKVAHKEKQSSYDETIVKARELIEVSPAEGKHLSLGSRKILNLMLQEVAGDAWEDRTFTIEKRVLRQRHKSYDQLEVHIKELQQTVLHFNVLSPRGKEAILSVPLLVSTISEKEKNGLYYFQFSEEVREMLRKSSTYAILSSRCVLSFESKYSLILYEIGCQRAGMKNPYIYLEIAKLRELLNVPPGTYRDFTSLRNKTILMAQNEINALAHFTMSFEAIRTGRKITSVKLGFWEKDSMGDAKAAELLRLTRNERRALVNNSNKPKDPTFIKLENDLKSKTTKYSPQISLDDEIIY